MTRDKHDERSWPHDPTRRLFLAEEKFRLLVESVRDYAIFLLDQSGHVMSWNAGARAIKGYEPAEIIGQHVSVFYSSIDRIADKPRALLDRALADGRVEDEGWRIRKDGSRFWADVVITVLRDHDGHHIGFAKVTRDLTERRQTKQKARNAEARLAATLYSIGDGVLVTDAKARVTMINRVAEGLTGWAEAEAVGLPIDEVFNIVNEHTRAPANNPVTRVLKEGVIVGLANHTALIARDGQERPIADSGAPIRGHDGGVHGAVLVFRDVTEERRAEEALRQSEERLRLMIASISDYAIFILDPEGRVVSWNRGAEKIKGYAEREIVGTHFSRFFTPDDVAAGKPARELEAAARDGRFEDEAWRTRKDGSVFWANVVISSIRDSSDRLVGFTKVTRDLTERRKAEEERIRLAQTRESLRLKDEFLSIASHELKTPLTALQLQLRSIFDRVEGRDEKLAQKMDRATRACERLERLIESLLDVSRISSGHFALNLESFDLVAAASEVIEGVRDAAASAGCALMLKSSAPVIGNWDRLRIEQIVTNLLSNAFKYAAGKAVEVTVTRRDESAWLEVRDGGHGVPESEIHRLFERFERASGTEYGGLGLGLYVARQMTEAHGGKISAHNVAGNGACFTVQLPLEPMNPRRTGGQAEEKAGVGA